MSEASGHGSSDTSLDAHAAGSRDAGVFATTHWSVVQRACAATTVGSAAALNQLCRRYWQPLYYFVRRRGYNPEDAQDLVQGFIGRLSYAEAAGKLSLSESAIKSAVHRLRQRYGELFAEEIARTVERPEDVDEEIRHILAALESG
jgi:hypothetical protein